MSRCECQGGAVDSCNSVCGASLVADEMNRVLELVNAQRARGGCCDTECFGPSSPLEASVLLAFAAQLHAEDMAENDYLSHTSRDGRNAFDRMTEAGFSGCAMAENIARGFVDPAAVVNGWLASPEHCVNLFWDRVRFVGVGHAVGPASLGADDFWVQDFGG